MSEYPLLDLSSIPSLLSKTERIAFYATITPKIAKDIVENYNYIHQRNLTMSKLNELKGVMDNDTFVPYPSIMFTFFEDAVSLVDGQHRSHAMVETNSTYVLPIIAAKVNPKYIYPKLDRGRKRSLKDAISSDQTAMYMGLSDRNTLDVARGVKIILNQYNIAPIGAKQFLSVASEDKLLEVVKKEYKQEAIHIFEVIDSLEYGRKLISRIPMAILLTLYKRLGEWNKSKLDEFIYGCASNINLGDGDPRRLIYTMYASSLRYGGTTKRTILTSSYELGNLLTCWEAWYFKKEVKKAFSDPQISKICNRSPNLEGTNIHFIGYKREVW